MKTIVLSTLLALAAMTGVASTAQADSFSSSKFFSDVARTGI